jgi:hypothetical protein
MDLGFPRATGRNGDNCRFWLLLAAQVEKTRKKESK